MNIQLIQGEFNGSDALELITQMVHIKIRYHENKIVSDSNEEDIKLRERKIRSLQRELYELRKAIHAKTNNVKLDAIINIE